MTEEEAKTKWCCGPLVIMGATLVASGGTPKADFARCIGSACMAWRATHAERGEILERQRALPGSKQLEGGDWGYVENDKNSASVGGDWVRFAPGPRHGFCGLAGKP